MVGKRSELMEYVEALVVAVVLAVFIITFIAQSFLVQGASMEPNLHNGERLLVDKVTYRFRPPKRGEVIVFKYPANPRRKFIKRVIGVPGDRIQIRDHKLYVNGKVVEEAYLGEPMLDSYGPVNIREGHIFVLGDNRNNSDDSRFPDVGQVPFNLVVGRALFLYWPLKETGIISRPDVFASWE